MEATVLNQERVLQGYLDALLSGAEPPALRQPVSERSHVSAGEKVVQSTVIPSAAKSALEGETGRSAAGPDANGCSSFIPIQPLGVAGLKLALDRRLVAEMTALPASVMALQRGGSNIWLTTLEHDGRIIHVLDTAALVVPAAHPQRAALLARCRYSCLVFLTELPVALAVEHTDEEIALPLDQVRWRSDRGAYPWLAATLPSFGYALVDPAGLPPPQA